MLFITLINDADNNGKDRKLDVPVDFLLDEFPSIGTIRILTEKWRRFESVP